MDDFYALADKNKDNGNRYNKFAHVVLTEFLEDRFKNELEVNEIKEGFVIMDRCIYDDYYIFAKTQLLMGKLNRTYDF